ncbi:hypothetical protein [uncultured Comamonas sp.]|uniref:hypothetical protein n=1 Tax=uncultured Comamonas sp. TaxID=114710 RepID=UPI002591D254|nr:hypothetical protein [uncultured Comamonas sp.]
MSWYRVGTVNVANGSSAVVGVGTAWVQAASVGETFLGPDSNVYEITAINSNTSLSISPAYKSGTSTAQSYAIMPTQGYLRDLAAQAAALVASYASVRDGAGQGKFAAGTATAPSLRGAADENTGINLPGNDILQLITAGLVRLQIAADGTPTGVFTEKLPVSTATQTAINNLAAACVALTNVGSAPAELPSNQHLGELAFLDTLGATSVTRHTRDSKPGDVWHEWVSNTQLIKKFHGFDNVIRTITETYA